MSAASQFPKPQPVTATCQCASRPAILPNLASAEGVLELETLRLQRSPSPIHHRFLYKCAVCGQFWERQTQPHPYGYSETWKKIEPPA